MEKGFNVNGPMPVKFVPFVPFERVMESGATDTTTFTGIPLFVPVATAPDIVTGDPLMVGANRPSMAAVEIVLGTPDPVVENPETVMTTSLPIRTILTFRVSTPDARHGPMNDN